MSHLLPCWPLRIPTALGSRCAAHTTRCDDAADKIRSIPSCPDSFEHVLQAVADHTSHCTRTHILIFDNVDRVSNSSVFTAFSELMETRPPRTVVVFSGRQDPPLPWLAMRSRGDLLELRAGDLAFNLTETGLLLRTQNGLNVSDQLVNELTVASNGWAAGGEKRVVERRFG